MERVAFLIEETNERLSALLNPETVRVHRQSGLRVLDERPGTIAGAGGSDDLLIATAGGRTEIELDLVFDVDMVLTEPRPVDVRELTGAIWRLSENDDGRPQPFRMIWGDRWNVPLVVESISERFDRFDRDGKPLRSWLSMRALRTGEADESSWKARSDIGAIYELTPRAPSSTSTSERDVVVLATGENGLARADEVSWAMGQQCQEWRGVADQVDPDLLPWIEAGLRLSFGVAAPALNALGGAAAERGAP